MIRECLADNGGQKLIFNRQCMMSAKQKLHQINNKSNLDLSYWYSVTSS